MISRFTHLIYGRSSTAEDPQTTADQSSMRTESTLVTSSTAENDEWLIVDRSDCEEQDVATDLPDSFDETPDFSQPLLLSSTSTPVKSDSSNTSGSEETSDFERFRGPYVSMQDYDPQSDAALSDVSSQPEHVTHPSLEECWIVTPPPCFTASDSAAADVVGMHPLENLLIEHPSMSVYWPRGRVDLEEDDLDPAEGEVEGQVKEGQSSEAVANDRAVEGDRISPQGPHAYQLVIDFNNEVFSYRSPFNYLHNRFIRVGNDSRINSPPTESSPSRTPQTSGPSSVGIQRPESGAVNAQQQRGTDYSFLTPHNIRLTANRLGTYLGLFIRGGPSIDEQKGQKQSTRVENSRKVLDQRNRVREVASSGKIRQRKDRMGCPSGRSNNRKC